MPQSFSLSPLLPVFERSQRAGRNLTMSKHLSDLGTTCKGNGSFYVCADNPSKFLGCCTVDPCKTDSGICPDEELDYTSYDRYSHNQIPQQGCQSRRPDVQWWTCASLDVPFMGCCSTNPCSEDDGCPRDDIFAARLSDVPKDAAVFLENDEPDSKDDASLSTSAVAGISAGASVVGILLVAAMVICFLSRRRRRGSRESGKDALLMGDTAPNKNSGSDSTPPREPRRSLESPSRQSHMSPPSPRTAYPSPPYWQALQGGAQPMWLAPSSQMNMPPHLRLVPSSPQELGGTPVEYGRDAGSVNVVYGNAPGQECEALGDVGWGQRRDRMSGIDVQKDPGVDWM